MSQLDLRWDLVTRFHAARERIYQAMLDASKLIPFDHVVIDTDSKPSSVSHGLRRENGHRSPVDIQAYLLVRPECSALVLDAVNEVCDMRAVPRELTAEQKVARYEAELARHGEWGTFVRRSALAGAR